MYHHMILVHFMTIHPAAYHADSRIIMSEEALLRVLVLCEELYIQIHMYMYTHIHIYVYMYSEGPLHICIKHTI